MRRSWKPWHEVVQLRDDVKTGDLALAVFAADLYDVVMQKGQRPVYEQPDEFFALTYPTFKLRELVKEVVLRLAGQSDRAYRKLSVTYGGGKTHTLIVLRHLVHDPFGLPDLPSVQEFEAHIGFKAPRARVAALCFDKIDLEKGIETLSPHGETRMLLHPWSVVAWQLAGADGLRSIHAEGQDQERDTPPAEPLMAALLSRPQQDGLSTLVLLDEVLMYVRSKVEADERWRGRLVNFFQHLGQAVTKVDRCAMVASLLASEPGNFDRLGQELLRDISEVFGRQTEEDASPVSKEDIAEVLRRRFFNPDSIRDASVFRPHVTAAVRNIAEFDEQTAKARGAVEERYLASYPFHPDVTETFYARWTQLDGFQKTRGILRTFAVALRDAAQWDTGPLVGPGVFLNEPGKHDLAEATGDLVSFANVEPGEGQRQEWRPILEGELVKARHIQAEAVGLHGREVEQAVVATFLNSQPTGHKISTRELFALLGATRPDSIELEKALRRWIELSWFLDEAEVESEETTRDGVRQLPGAWRLGNRPNLRQMHHEACYNRVPATLIEEQLLKAIESLRTPFFTSGASAAGARVHFLPHRPRDIADDGEFRYAILGPTAASEANRPSAEAKRFIAETTGPDRPRVHRNAVILAVPSRDGLDAARGRVKEYLGWLEVGAQLKDQAVDVLRAQMLAHMTAETKKRIPNAVKQAYAVVVTVNANNDIHAFKVKESDASLFVTIKADARARIQETAISAEAMLPGGPYDLWREGETSRRVKDLVDAFARFPKLPKMLRRQAIRETVGQGVEAGIWVARMVRPDRSIRTFWRTAVDESVLKDAGLEVWLPEAAVLNDIAPELLACRALPGLWPQDSIVMQDVFDYFAGDRTVAIPQEGYEEEMAVPQCESANVKRSVARAVEQDKVWLSSGSASLLGEPVPLDLLDPSAVLQPPPPPIPTDELLAESIPDAWQDDKTNALEVARALSARQGRNLPWSTVRATIDEGIRVRWIEVGDDGAQWPCDVSRASHVILRLPDRSEKVSSPPPVGLLAAEAVLESGGIQDLAEQIAEIVRVAAGSDLKITVRMELGGASASIPAPQTVAELNALLSRVSVDLRFE